MKRTIPLMITALVGMLMILHGFLPAVTPWVAERATVFFGILAAIAFILGGGNLVRLHGERVLKQRAGWAYSLVTLLCFFTMLICGLFKIGVPAKRGFLTWLERPGGAVGLVQIETAQHAVAVLVRRAPPGTTQPVRLRDEAIGQIVVDGEGRGALTLAAAPETPMAALIEGLRPGDAIVIGDVLEGPLRPYTRFMSQHNSNGSAFWFLYEYAFYPMSQTLFASLAFYVASAAFRAFRARNIESVLLLGTAFIILLGRTAAGTVLTGWLPEEGFWSFFRIDALSGWVSSVIMTAGQRAIMIGIALGVASTSLKVILGVDRSYLGSDRG